MKCIFPLIKASIDDKLIAIEDFISVLGISEQELSRKLSGEESFDINEAMKINEDFYPNVPFKVLFAKSK